MAKKNGLEITWHNVPLETAFRIFREICSGNVQIKRVLVELAKPTK